MLSFDGRDKGIGLGRYLKYVWQVTHFLMECVIWQGTTLWKLRNAKSTCFFSLDWRPSSVDMWGRGSSTGWLRPCWHQLHTGCRPLGYHYHGWLWIYYTMYFFLLSSYSVWQPSEYSYCILCWLWNDHFTCSIYTSSSVEKFWCNREIHWHWQCI